MNFSKFDIKVLVVSSFALLLISATASATPIAGNFGNMPTYQSTSSLDLSVPDQPGPDISREGTIRTGPGVPTYEQNTKMVVTEDREISLTGLGYNPSEGDYTVNTALHYTNRTTVPANVTSDNIQLSPGESALLEANDVGVEVRFTDNSSESATIQYEFEYSPPFGSSNDGGSGLWGALYSIAEWLGYFADLAIFALDALLAGIVFTFTTLVDIVIYVVDIFVWISDGYGSILNSAPVWASGFVAIPILALGFELMKLFLLVIEILWIG